MPRKKDWPACVSCNKPASEAVYISTRGLCEDCGIGAALQEVSELRAKEGPHFRYWRRRSAEAFERLLADTHAASDTEER